MNTDKRLFSQKLRHWLDGSSNKTFESLNEAFAEKSFAVAILILMAVPALPIPTGGVTHVFEVIAIILAAQMLIGRKQIMQPKKFKNVRPGKTMERTAIPKLIDLISWFEKRFKPRHSSSFQMALVSRAIAVLLMIFIAFAFMAPPFSGLDTLPSLGAVIICLSIVLDNLFLTAIGLTVGLIGIAVVLELGKIIINLFG